MNILNMSLHHRSETNLPAGVAGRKPVVCVCVCVRAGKRGKTNEGGRELGPGASREPDRWGKTALKRLRY